ncbi:Aste57867_3049 [Aphanomyces stellatus]|uniref:Aste57867_3049 protein n=1 Tax=Aphanomyces stellatus TaxID=120398 RepID=A0A485KBD2_9STRA|nr:hypothetical protein As57867_003040 [Aphanomyces stellatus]VFT80229.1 Aste57867_3049 [Aphanomyces stellatus]
MMGLERRGSIQAGDDFWIDVQKKAFTKWANSYLDERDLPIADLYADLSDGLRLIALLEELTNGPITTKYNKEPRFRIHKLENLNIVFGYLAKAQVQVTNIGSSDIVDGNSKLILGLVWTIIKRYQVADIEIDGVSGKEGLLLWCNRALAAYGVTVTNFTSQWSNGLAFCYLVHAYNSSIIDVDNLSADTPLENLSLAFTALETHFSIPALLAPEDLQGKVDEKSVLTYISMVYQEVTEQDKVSAKKVDTPSKVVAATNGFALHAVREETPADATADNVSTAQADTLSTNSTSANGHTSYVAAVEAYKKPVADVARPLSSVLKSSKKPVTPVSFAALGSLLVLLYPVVRIGRTK